MDFKAIIDDYVSTLKKFADFAGRARRREFWMFFLITMIICIVLGIINGFITEHPILPGLFLLAILLPNIAVIIRRLHDIGKSGLWALLLLIPFVGLIILIFACIDSQPGSNQYGPNPKGM